VTLLYGLLMEERNQYKFMCGGSGDLVGRDLTMGSYSGRKTYARLKLKENFDNRRTSLKKEPSFEKEKEL